MQPLQVQKVTSGIGPSSRVLNAVLIGLILALAVPGAARNAPVLLAAPEQVDFATYYLAADVLNSANPTLYRDDLLQKQAAARGVQQFAPPYIYPPFFAGLLRPLAQLDFDSAKMVWFGLNVFFLVLSVPVLIRLSGLPIGARSIAVGLALVALFPPVHQALDLGQVSPLLLLLCAISLYLTIDTLNRRHQAAGPLAGILLAFAAMVKVFPALLMPYALVAKRFGIFAASLFGISLCVLLGVLLGGRVGNNGQYLTVLLAAYGDRLANVIPTNLSFSAFFMRLLTQTSVDVALLSKDSVYTVVFSNVADDKDLALAFTFISTAFVLGVTAVALYRQVRKPVTANMFAAGFCAVLLASLLVISTLYYHLFVLFLIPLAILVRAGTSLNRHIMLTAALVIYLLIVIQRYSNWIAVYTHSPWLVSLGLYAALLLWGSMVYLAAWRSQRVEGEQSE